VQYRRQDKKAKTSQCKDNKDSGRRGRKRRQGMKPTLEKQMQFIKEIEKLKLICRQNSVIDQSRQENSAEHSWHVAIIALILSEYASNEVNISRVIKMLLIHDIVEIDAGDTWLYDEKAEKEQPAKEEKAATRLFGLLPQAQNEDFLALWKEFNERKTADAIFASAIDGLQPLVNHFLSGSTRNVNILESRIAEKKQYINNASPELWDYAKNLIHESAIKGLYKKDL